MGYDERLELSDGRLVWYLDEGPDDGRAVVFCHGSPVVTRTGNGSGSVLKLSP